MKIFIPLAATCLLLTGCVSQKKYQAAITELDKLKATHAVQSAMEKTEKKGEMVDNSAEVMQMQQTIQELEAEVTRLRKRIESEGTPELSPQEMQILETELAQKHEQQMMEMEKNMRDQESVNLLMENKNRIERVKAAAKAALPPSETRGTKIASNYSSVTISIQSSEIFNDAGELSENGKSIADKLSVLMENREGMNVMMVDATSGKPDNRINKLHDYLSDVSSYKTARPIVGTAPCNYSKTHSDLCDRVDVVFYLSNEMVLQMINP